MSSGHAHTVGLYVRTLAHLPPSQVVHRVRLRATTRALAALGPNRAHRAALHFAPSPPAGRQPAGAAAGAGWPSTFVPLGRMLAPDAPSAEDNVAGSFELVGERRDLGSPIDWSAPAATRLWRFELHYWEWAWSFVRHPDRAWARRSFEKLWRAWDDDVVLAHGDAWAPYPAALRAWVWCDLYDALAQGGPIDDEFVDSLRVHAGFLRLHQEDDVGGNHLLKSLKALAGLAAFFDDRRLATRVAERLGQQIGIQVMSDGGHFERTTSYHCQVLADLIDVQRLADAGGMPRPAGLDAAIERMRRWIGAMTFPDGGVAQFNDAGPVAPEVLTALRAIAPADQRAVVLLGASGFVRARTDRLDLVADVGDAGPPELPAHVHADSLSFELAVDGHRVVVDTGTSTYEAGHRRNAERSTRAHNTIEVDGVDSTEVWAAFRAARMARGFVESVDDENGLVTITARHDGYRHLGGIIHSRTWTLAGATLIVDDHLHAPRPTEHGLRVSLHLAPGTSATVNEDGSVLLTTADGITVVHHFSVDGIPRTARVVAVEIADGFGVLRSSYALVFTGRFRLPVSARTTLRSGRPMTAESPGGEIGGSDSATPVIP